MYNPQVGRFSSLDPFTGDLNDPRFFHKYGYANNDPIMFVDPMGEFGLTGMMVGMQIAGFVREAKNQTDLAVFDAFATMVAGVQAGQNANQILASFFTNQIVGFGIGFAMGRAGKIIGDLFENGAVIVPAAKSSAQGAVRRPLALLHNGPFNFPRSAQAHAPSPAPPVLRIDELNLGHFNAMQRPRVDEWMGWINTTDGAFAPRMRQAQVNVDGMKISGNLPDLQFSLQGGRRYRLPNGAEITLPPGQNQRVYIEFDPFNGGRSSPHARNLLGDDPSGIVVLDVFDGDGLVSSVTFSP